ncbi:hypothetical protein COCC4DRAFT_45103 [Bipolaris maydis ATCC 48331]|uniref:Uncharacterized protein n=2 Tax=Cochliobolus heterostrophus TaxID=5016 RepID=M2ULU4_COCH5|nr:uncharacterized protein COCC4DRAFT_45103 [Bipolaris maydis ATCC 48331]EMD94591.1 hypothetical protein COCHEDRAFT_1027161 [Bipolaris maydis C5]KAH7556217.1 hypothetical protein BM1_06743 [Bipolaris maydis]ENH99676.1 hypothetical protein COCC4DRAFT_45103 [Bipolaris maydis ATCC 48331]KAJ5029029.1 hypothetical protein J3E73DRAFT_388541 [Bipolaris maydis]KAJ5062245.1 hypothetical protein J3E74DRAFT_289513 [Bipolaris maydis]
MAFLILWLLLCTSVSFAHQEELLQLGSRSLNLHPFHYNMMVNTSAEDPELDRYLWKGIKNDDAVPTKTGGKVITYSLQSKLGKRARQTYGPLIKTPCLFCGKKARSVSNVNLGQFTPESMIQRMKWGATFGQCLFYGQRSKALKDNPDYRGASLSRWTTDWGCLQPAIRQEFYRTIWQLWPNEKGDVRDSCETGQNYYCLDYSNPRCCWLNGLLGEKSQWKDNGMKYFKAMSRAMAMTCTGEVFVMLDNKKMLKKQYTHALDTPSIWLYDELPELQKRYNQGVVTKLTVIRVGDMRRFDRTGYAFRNEPEPSDASEGDAGAPPSDENTRFVRSVSEDDKDEKEVAAMAIRIAEALKKKQAELILTGGMEQAKSEWYNLQKRGVCPSGADQETPGMDWFG